jgi:hypothetical protein
MAPVRKCCHLAASRRFKQGVWSSGGITTSQRSSPEVTAPCRVSNLKALVPSWLRHSPHVLHRCRLDSRVFAFQAPEYNGIVLEILSWASAPLQRLPKHRAAAKKRGLAGVSTLTLSSECPVTAPPLRFLPLQRFPTQGSGMNRSVLPLPTACAFRCSQPLGAFIRPEPAGLVSCRIRSWGHPPELSSSRAAVRCFQRLSPPGVRNAFRVLLRAGVRYSMQGFRLSPSAWLSWVFCPSGFSSSPPWFSLH